MGKGDPGRERVDKVKGRKRKVGEEEDQGKGCKEQQKVVQEK